MRAYDLILLPIAILAAAIVIQPNLLTVASFLILTGIGIPITILAWSAVPLAMVLLPARILQRFVLETFLPVFLAWAVSVGLVMSGLVWAASQDRAGQRAEAERWLAADHDGLTGPAAVHRLGIISQSGQCEALCQRLLLNGTVKAVIMAKGGDVALPLNPEHAATIWAFETRQGCPVTHVPTDNHLTVRREATGKAAPDTSRMIRQAAAQGLCLVERPGVIAEADIVIAQVSLRSAPSPRGSGFRSGADRLAVTAQIIWTVRDGQLSEAFRATKVTGPEIAPILVVTGTASGGMDIGLGYLRPNTFQMGNLIPFEGFVAARLGLNLSLAGPLVLPDLNLPPRDVFARRLAAPGAFSDADVDLARDFVGTILNGRCCDAEDCALFLRMIEDPRIPLFREAALITPDYFPGADAAWKQRYIKAAVQHLASADKAEPPLAARMLAGLSDGDLHAHESEIRKVLDTLSDQAAVERLIVRLRLLAGKASD